MQSVVFQCLHGPKQADQLHALNSSAPAIHAEVQGKPRVVEGEACAPVTSSLLQLFPSVLNKYIEAFLGHHCFSLYVQGSA
jgi:hypothetical protein